MTEFQKEYADEQLKLAEQRGRREQLVDSRLADHDRQFLALNGSIDRLARGQERATQELGKVNGKLEKVESLSDKVNKNSDKLTEVATDIEVSRELQEKAFKVFRLATGLLSAVAVITAALIGAHVI